MTTEQIAKLCHEANRAYCLSIGDDSQPSWEEAPEWQRRSAVDGVLYHITYPDTTPAQSHANWLKPKKTEGWTYGPVKDPKTKTHPCFVAYAQLPEEQRYKDLLFGCIVSAARTMEQEDSGD